MAANTHISISKYKIAVPTLSKNVRKAVKMLNSKLIGNKIIFIIHLIKLSPSLYRKGGSVKVISQIQTIGS